MENLHKRGEITTTQLVTIIVLIVSFVIILFLMFRLGLGRVTDQEICHNSVVLKGESQLVSGPLDCKINYMTIKGETKVDVMHSIANEMEDCWWMFGEGKIDYGSDSTNDVHYAICSIIDFDEKTKEKISEITYAEFYDYLQQTERKNSGRSYLYYLYSVDAVSALEREDQFTIDISQDKILTQEKYSIMTGIDNGLGPLDDEILKVNIIPSEETSVRLAENREFITKA